MNLISAEMRTQVHQAFEDIFDSFARPEIFTIYKNAKETILSLGSDDYSQTWNSQPPQLSYEEVSQSFPARVWYLDYEQQLKAFFLSGKELENVRFLRELGQIKIQVKQDAYDFIKDATHAYFMGDMWEITSDVKGVGIFDFKYFTFILRRRQ